MQPRVTGVRVWRGACVAVWRGAGAARPGQWRGLCVCQAVSCAKSGGGHLGAARAAFFLFCTLEPHQRSYLRDASLVLVVGPSSRLKDEATKRRQVLTIVNSVFSYDPMPAFFLHPGASSSGLPSSAAVASSSVAIKRVHARTRNIEATRNTDRGCLA